MTPSTRKEIYLNKIATGEGAVPTPATREEMYLAKIAGEEIGVPTPATRAEMCLYKIGGGEIIVPTPATRLEMFLAAASGMPVSTPVPATREETLWDYIINGTNPQTITGVPPISFTGDGNPLISWSMKGNGSQQGTPTPDNPVMPEFVGVRTANLWNPDSRTTNQVGQLNWGVVLPAGTYTITNNSSVTVYFRDGLDSTSTARFANAGETGTKTASTELVAWCNSSQPNIMLNLGSTALPYEPYGYKIPITNAGQTTPIYLGQTPTVRRINKLVLTGKESYTYQSQYSRCVFTVQSAFSQDTRKTQCFCSHYQSVHNGEPIADIPNNSIYINQQAGGTQFCIKDELITSVEDFKSYLAAQYAAGMPVTVWYVLAEPETGIVNEPLAKIGDYADELHSEDAGVTIPTVKGQNTLTVDTPIQPSEMSITGYIAESQTMTAAKIMARASGMNVNDKELESLSKKELNLILKGTVKSDGRGASSNR